VSPEANGEGRVATREFFVQQRPSTITLDDTGAWATARSRKRPVRTLENDTGRRYYTKLSGKHQATLAAIFARPERADIAWRDIESLPAAAGAELSEGNGSRVRVALNGVRAVSHRPHRQQETDKGAVRSVRRFLPEAKIRP
jgi:hypothetical protein